jgi:hypothetical protein
MTLGPRTQAPKPRQPAPKPDKKSPKTPRHQLPQSPAYLITSSNVQPTQGSLELTRGAFSPHDAADPNVTPMHTMLQYQAYRLPPSDYLYVEGLPADLRGLEIPGILQHIASTLEIQLSQTTSTTQLKEELRRGHLQRIHNNQFGTTLLTGHHNYTFGHHHRPINRLAVRIFPCGFHRPKTMNWNPVWPNYLVTYLSIHPVSNMGPHTADYVAHAGSDLVGFIRFTEQIAADPTGRLDVITPFLQALLNSQFLAIHRYLSQRLAGIDFFPTISRVSANYTPGNSHSLQTETIIHISIQRTRVTNFDGSHIFLTDSAHLAQAQYALGFQGTRQRMLIECQAYLLELLHPSLLQQMTKPQPLLPAPDIRTPRPFLALRNVDPNTNLVLILKTLQRHDAESETLAHTHGLPATSILANTNHVIHVPASLFPAPRPDQRRPQQAPSAPTSVYLLIPRAGTHVTLSTILSALGQGGAQRNPHITRNPP